MKKAPIPHDDAKRLEELYRLKVLDTEIDEDLQNLVELASDYLGCPISLISLVDEQRQWFKARKGLRATETPRDISFCGHAIMEDKVFVVEDTLKNEDFRDNPLVQDAPFIRFYAGAPLTTSSGHRIGTLCLIDQKSKIMSSEDRRFLQKIARQAMALIELKYKELKLAESQRLNSYFIHHLIHDIRNPLNAILMASEVLKRKITDQKLLGWLEKSILSTKRVNNLTSDLINLGDLSAGTSLHLNPEDPDLREALAGPLSDLEALHPRRLDIEFEDGDYSGNFDGSAIYRACENFIINGIKLGGPTEKIYLKTFSQAESIKIEIRTTGESVSIDEKDAGISPRDMRVSIGRGLIESHGGRLEIRDDGDKTEYVLEIPRKN